jgi:serine/threonine protein kinase/tetratricopeptide (TPR) repeat protein
VEALLAEDAGVQNFLEQPAEEAMAELFTQAVGESCIGRQLGPYEVLSLLGEGGMGEVYLARDTTLGREVALKVLSKEIAAEPDYLRRFEEEARLASSLNHPNIVTIYGVGKEDEVTFIAMELVRGRTLRAILDDGAIPVRQALDMAFQICDALAAAHTAGIVHRDLKPENVMVTADDRVKVLDFGLAKRHIGLVPNPLSNDHNAAGNRTVAGTILGTVGYMSPEQAMGKAAGHTSDQFSFGVIFYEMLSGRRAFARETVVETLSAIIREQPPSIGTLNPDVPEPLRQIVERCLAKEPAERYVETNELATLLRDLRDQMLAEGSSAHSLIQFKRLNRRRAIWLGGTAALGVIAGLANWELWPRDTGIRSLAVLPFETTTQDEDAEFLSILIAESLIRHIASLRSLRVLPRNAGLTFKGKNVDPIAAGRLLDVDAVVTGTIVRRSGRLHITAELTSVRMRAVLWGDTYDEDEADLLVIQDKIASTIVNTGIRVQLSGEERAQFERRVTNNAEAYELYARGLYHQDKEQEEDYLTARGLLEQAVEKDANFALAYAALARNHIIMAVDGYAPPTDMWPQVYRYTRRALELDPTLLEANSGLAAEAFWYRWDWQEAEKQYEIASRSPLTGELMGWVFLRWAVGRYDDALQVIRKARTFDPLGVLWRLREAALLTQSGKLDQGGKLYEEIMHDEPKDARAYFGLAETRRMQSRFDEAIALIRRGSELDAQDGLLPDPLEEALSAARGIDGYRKVEKALAEIELENLKSRVVDAYVSPVDFARVHARLGNKEEAIGYLDAAVKEPSPGVVFLKVDHVWDTIRDDSRFQDGVRTIGLP